jgi:transposase
MGFANQFGSDSSCMLVKGVPAWMAKALSVDLRRRVVRSIEQGMSRRKVAERDGVSVASAVRWHQQFKATGTVSPNKQGGDRRSKRIEAYGALIVETITNQPT